MAAFPGSSRGQFGLLCAANVDVNALARLGRVLDALIEPEWSASLPARGAAGVRLALRPGTDGDLAGLLTEDAELLPSCIEALAQSAREAGCGFSLVDEAGFADALAA